MTRGIVMLLRILKWAGIFVAIALAAWLIGLAINNEIWARDWSTIDDGWASLVGSAMGSFFAVVGALYVTKATERRKKKEFEDFVRVAVQNLVLQSSYLEAMAREPTLLGPTPDGQAGVISIQLRTLTDALAVFDREIANSKDGDYTLRRNIIALDAMLSEVRHALIMDHNPIQTIRNWHVAAYQVRQHSSSFLHTLRWVIPMPTSEMVGDRMKEFIATWRRWNIPEQSTQATTRGDVHPLHEPMHHAHA